MSNLLAIDHLKGKKIAILGFGREGLSTSRFLKKHKIRHKIIDFKFDKNYLDKIKDFEVLFRTPGFPRLHPKLLAAQKKGALVTSNTKLFFDLCPCQIIGFTGTKGKTTTALLAYKILKDKYGKRVFAAGNFGKPALDLLPRLDKDSLVVLELSSFQLQDLDKSPRVAVITNITVDHLDPGKKFNPASHQTAKEYFDAKINILKHQKPEDFAIIHPSLKNKTENVGKGRKIFSVPYPIETKLKGRHNLENIALAVAVGKLFKVPVGKMIEAVRKFKGIEHRLEFVARINGVSFYNDSAATNPDATLAALRSFKEPIHLILGGSDKGLGYGKLIFYISKSRNVRSVTLIGQLKNKLYKLIKKHNQRKSLSVKKVETLKDAVLTLYKKTAKNDVVLLSPAAASFDMFESYAKRGEEFKKLVRQIQRRVR